MSSSKTTDIDIVALAHAYRRLVLSIGLQILVSVAHPGWSFSGDESGCVLPTFSIVLLLITIGITVYYGHRTAQALRLAVPVIWALAMLLPCVNLLTLLVLSTKATAACRERGVPVGFLGPDLQAARRSDTREVADTFGGPSGTEPR